MRHVVALFVAISCITSQAAASQTRSGWRGVILIDRAGVRIQPASPTVGVERRQRLRHQRVVFHWTPSSRPRTVVMNSRRGPSVT